MDAALDAALDAWQPSDARNNEPEFPNPFLQVTNANTNAANESQMVTTRSGRRSKATPRYIEAMLAEATIAECKENSRQIEGEIFCLEAMFPDAHTDQANPLLAFKATVDPDKMYMHKAM
jgi:hypothetical protein